METVKAKVRLSAYCMVITAVITAALLGGVWLTRDEPVVMWTFVFLLGVVIVSALLYSPRLILLTDKDVILRSWLKSRRIHLADIESAEPYQPTMASRRIFGAGGFMGYWGIFSERDTGRYYVFYGRASDCFILRLRNGDKYVLGGITPLLPAIRARIDRANKQ